ncbi:MAG: squalene--hopene cyclase [Chloroflexi bacterium]|nr:squalene--hopene cyclase [Chloroflexota bacterium]
MTSLTGMASSGTTESAPPWDKLGRAIRGTQAFFRQNQYTGGYWWGVLESNPTMEAEYLLLSHFLGKEDPERWRKIRNNILKKQREDGSWGQYYQAPGDLSISVECYFALKLQGCSPESDALIKARDFILSRGGVPNSRVFTKIWLALFGQWDWSGVPNLPPELILVPPSVPFSIYDFAGWARPTIVPMLIILSHRPCRPVPDWAQLDELYPRPRSETDYSLPKPQGGLGWARFLYHLDQAVGLYQRLPVHPFRGWAERKVVDWLLGHQEANGCWAGIQPPWVYSLIALHQLGFGADHPVMDKGFNGLDGYAIEDEDTFSVQGCISPVWDTCLAQIALLESGLPDGDPMIKRSTLWLLDQQILEPGDWQVRAKDTKPGGWAFEFYNSRYPDIDDTAEVIMALNLARLDPEDEPRRKEAIQRGVDWILALQSKDGGWGAFDKDNNRRYVSRLPFSDFGEVLDPTSADVTAHVVEMLGKLGYPRDFTPIRRAIEYIRQEQEEDGSWFGRWGVNYIYGVGAVLPALVAVEEDMTQPYVRRAIQWLVARQNDDGGWGESCGSYVDPDLRGVGPSTASQTAWALLALLAAGESAREEAHRGLQYLMETQTAAGFWEEPYYTGTGFPGYGEGAPPQTLPKPGESGYQGLDMPAGFMLNYNLYRNYWPLLAMGRYSRLSAQQNGNIEPIPTVGARGTAVPQGGIQEP